MSHSLNQNKCLMKLNVSDVYIFFDQYIKLYFFFLGIASKYISPLAFSSSKKSSNREEECEFIPFSTGILFGVLEYVKNTTNDKFQLSNFTSTHFEHDKIYMNSVCDPEQIHAHCANNSPWKRTHCVFCHFDMRGLNYLL